MLCSLDNQARREAEKILKSAGDTDLGSFLLLMLTVAKDASVESFMRIFAAVTIKNALFSRVRHIFLESDSELKCA